MNDENQPEKITANSIESNSDSKKFPDSTVELEVVPMPVKKPGTSAFQEKNTPKGKSNRGLFVGSIIVIVAVAIGGVVISINSRSTSKTATASTKLAQVSITATAFVPSNIQVKPGTMITWTDTDTNQHQVASDPYPSDNALPGLNGPLLSKNDSYS